MSGHGPGAAGGGTGGAGPPGLPAGPWVVAPAPWVCGCRQKARDFRGSLRRMASRLRPERFVIAVVLILGAISVFLAVLGPKLLGNATNLIFEGVIGKRLPAGMTQAQAEQMLRALGRGQQADMLSGMTITPARASTSPPSGR